MEQYILDSVKSMFPLSYARISSGNCVIIESDDEGANIISGGVDEESAWINSYCQINLENLSGNSTPSLKNHRFLRSNQGLLYAEIIPIAHGNIVYILNDNINPDLWKQANSSMKAFSNSVKYTNMRIGEKFKEVVLYIYDIGNTELIIKAIKRIFHWYHDD